jgi:hypothetical protein
MGDLMDFISMCPLAFWFHPFGRIEINYLQGNEDGEGVEEHAEMLGLMVLTCIDALKEHDLFTPNSEVKNIPIICLIALEFAVQSCQDLEITWACEVVRLCDDAGIKLDDHVRKQVNISKKDLKKLRGEYKSNPEGMDKDWKSEVSTFGAMIMFDLTSFSVQGIPAGASRRSALRLDQDEQGEEEDAFTGCLLREAEDWVMLLGGSCLLSYTVTLYPCTITLYSCNITRRYLNLAVFFASSLQP